MARCTTNVATGASAEWTTQGTTARKVHNIKPTSTTQSPLRLGYFSGITKQCFKGNDGRRKKTLMP